MVTAECVSGLLEKKLGWDIVENVSELLWENVM